MSDTDYAQTGYCFRLKFRLPPHIRIQIDEPVWPLVPADERPSVVLRSIPDDEPIKEADWLVVRGMPYSDGRAAMEAGRLWQAVLEVAFAAVRVGADFGLRSPTGGFTEKGLELVEKSTGKRVLNDVHGLSVFACDPRPAFAAVSADAKVGRNPDNLRTALNEARTWGPSLDETRNLAFHLYSSSFFEPSADARFLMLMMAIETLIDLLPREESAAAHVRDLMARTRDARLSDRERDSLLGSLKALLKESIGSAGRRLASRLTPKTYMDLPPVDFFTRCYRLRGELVHGSVPRPGLGEVGQAAAYLEAFVGDLLSQP